MKNIIIVVALFFLSVSCTESTQNVYRVKKANGTTDFLETNKSFSRGDSIDAFQAIYGTDSQHLLIDSETWRMNGYPVTLSIVDEHSRLGEVGTYRAVEISTNLLYHVQSPYLLCSGDEMVVKTTATGNIVVVQLGGVISNLKRVRIL